MKEYEKKTGIYLEIHEKYIRVIFIYVYFNIHISLPDKNIQKYIFSEIHVGLETKLDKNRGSRVYVKTTETGLSGLKCWFHIKPEDFIGLDESMKKLDVQNHTGHCPLMLLIIT